MLTANSTLISTSILRTINTVLLESYELFKRQGEKTTLFKHCMHICDFVIIQSLPLHLKKYFIVLLYC